MCPELDRVASRPILMSVRDALSKSRGVAVSDDAVDVLLDFADRSIASGRFPDKAIDLLEQAIAHAIVTGSTSVDRDAAVATTVAWAARASWTPTLQRFGRDLVALARDGKLGPIVGRDRELDAIVEVLLRRTKRNPILLGPAGSGKTAIVEGLAIRIANGEVPAALRDIRLFDVPLLTLAAAITTEPSVLVDFLVEVRHPSVAVFFDEIHQLTSPAVADLAESLKPALARGEIACIGATTSEEYQARLEPETALARRFTEIPVEPLDQAAVRRVLVAVRDSLAKARGISVSDEALDELTALAARFLPNRAFPDKGVDVIEQSVAYAITHGLAAVDVATAREAVAAMIGMPLDRGNGLAPGRPSSPIGRRSNPPRPRPSSLDSGCPSRPRHEPGATGRYRPALQRRCEQRPSSQATFRSDDLGGRLRDHRHRRFGDDGQFLDLDAARFGTRADRVDRRCRSTSSAGHRGPSSSARHRRLRDLDPRHDRLGAPRRVFTDAMGRRIPLGSAIVLLTAPGVGLNGDDARSPVLAIGSASPRLGVRRDHGRHGRGRDRVASKMGGGRAAGPTGGASCQSRLPRDVRARAGVMGGRAPPEGWHPPGAFLDARVTSPIVASLPPSSGPVRIGVVNDAPAVLPD